MFSNFQLKLMRNEIHPSLCLMARAAFEGFLLFLY